MAKMPNNTIKTPTGTINSNKARKGVAGIPLDKQKIMALIVQYRGNLSRCAAALGCARDSIRRIANTDEEVKKCLEDARERIVDDVEDAFLEKVLKGDTTAAIFFLKTRARERGYDQDFRADIEGVTRTALSWALNKSKNPAQHTKPDTE